MRNNTGPNKNTINLVMPCSFFGKKNHGNIIIIETIYLIWKDSHSHSAKYYLSKNRCIFLGRRSWYVVFGGMELFS